MPPPFPSRQRVATAPTDMITTNLPVEIFALALDYLDFCDLLHASHVSQSWRSAALDHPTFWRRIRLHSASHTAVDCFKARIGCQKDLPLALDVDIVAVSEHERVRMLEEVLPAIRTNLHRLSFASIRVPSTLALDLFAHLDQPAHWLYHLALSLKLPWPPDEAPVDLPHDLFRDDCPLLHTLILKNIVLPPCPIPILAGVDIAVYQHTYPRVVTFPVALFLKAAPLRIVELMAVDFILPEDLWSATVQNALCQLESISLTYSDDQSNIVSVLPLQDIPEVILAPPKIPAGRLVMAHLDGPLRLDITSNSRGTADTIVAYTSSSKQRRSFFEVQADFFDKRPDINPAPFYFDTAYTDRITSLTVSSSRWRIVTRHAPRLPKCTSLTLELDDVKYLRPKKTPPRAPPAFPSLGTLTLRLANAEISCAGWRNLVLHVGELPETCRLIFETVSLDFFDDDWVDNFHDVDVRWSST